MMSDTYPIVAPASTTWFVLRCRWCFELTHVLVHGHVILQVYSTYVRHYNNDTIYDVVKRHVIKTCAYKGDATVAYIVRSNW